MDLRIESVQDLEGAHAQRMVQAIIHCELSLREAIGLLGLVLTTVTTQILLERLVHTFRLTIGL